MHISEYTTQIENYRLQSELLEAQRYAEKLENLLFEMGAMKKPPCFKCGFSGPGYFNAEKHPCAKKHFELRKEV